MIELFIIAVSAVVICVNVGTVVSTRFRRWLYKETL